MAGSSTALPEGNGAVVGDLHPVEAQQHVVLLQLGVRGRAGRHAADEHALVVVRHAQVGPQHWALQGLVVAAQGGEAAELAMLPANAHPAVLMMRSCWSSCRVNILQAARWALLDLWDQHSCISSDATCAPDWASSAQEPTSVQAACQRCLHAHASCSHGCGLLSPEV